MSTKVTEFDPWQQRTALTDFADQGIAFLDTAAGASFLEQMDLFVAPKIVAYARDWGYAIERKDVTHLIVEKYLTLMLRNPERSSIHYAASADIPWAYIVRSVRRWQGYERGLKGINLEVAEALPASEIPGRDSDLTNISDVVQLTFDQLAPRVKSSCHAQLFRLLSWLAANPLQRISYEGNECVAAHRQCPNFTIEQVKAVMNIAWGGRPRQAETSLMYQYLKNPHFRPAESPTHARALTYFKSEFRAGEQGSRMLTDWNAA